VSKLIDALISNKMIKMINEFLTLEEAAKFLSISNSSLYKKTSNKEIPYYVPGGKKIYFKKADLENWILKSKVESIEEIETSTENYLTNPLKSKSNV
jgi:excisionase family DNA binding protein